MANLSFSKVATVGSTGLVAGRIYFETSTGLIKVATSATATDIFGGVRSASYSEETKVLTIINQAGETITLDLSDVASADSVTTELAKKLNIGTSADASTVPSYYGLKKYADEAEAAALTAAKAYTDEQIEAIPAAVVYKGDGTTITQSGIGTVTFAVGTIAQSKVSGLSTALAGKANATHTHTKSQITDFDEADYATAAQGTKADTAIQTVRASNTGTNISIAAAKSGTTINLTPSLTTSTVTSGGSGLVVASDAKSYIASQIAAAQVSALKYKGSCTYAELPKSPAQGDVWNVTDKHGNVPAGTNYAWDGDAWDPLAGAVDLSPYLLSSTAASTYATITALNAKPDSLADLGVTATAAELNKLDGCTATVTELNYVDGVTSNIQTQLNAKVSNSRTVNGKPLSANVTIGGGDIIVGGSGDHAADSVATAIAELEDAIATAQASGVTSFGGQTGAITVNTTAATNGQVKFAMSSKQLTGTVVGLGSAAYTASTAYATAAQGTKADSALQKADITTGTTNGTILVDGSAVAVKGLGSAAYTATTAYDAAGTAATQAASALSQAKTYADGLWVWAEFN